MASATTIHFLNVGQGDCIVVESNESLIVVDSNKPRPHGPFPLLEYLKQRHENTDRRPIVIDILCITHPDRDHYSGMREAVRFVLSTGGRVSNKIYCGFGDAFKQEFLRAKRTFETSTSRAGWSQEPLREYEQFIDLLENAGGALHLSGGFQPLGHFGELEVALVGPSHEAMNDLGKAVRQLIASWKQYPRPSQNPSPSANSSQSQPPRPSIPRCPANRLSAILRLQLGDHGLLLTGDSDHEELMHSLTKHSRQASSESYKKLFEPAHIVKAPHHGASSGSHPEMWKQIMRPDGHVVISNGRHLGYKHPDSQTMNDLRTHVSPPQIYCTNTCLHHKPDPNKRVKTSAPPHIRTEARSKSRAFAYNDTISFNFGHDGISVVCAQPQDVCPFHMPVATPAHPVV